MKNKYQEALEYNRPFADIQYKDKYGKYPREVLQELVDKSIVKRPIGISQTYEGRVANCPSCEKFISEKTDKYYHSDKDCLQKLDWNKNE